MKHLILLCLVTIVSSNIYSQRKALILNTSLVGYNEYKGNIYSFGVEYDNKWQWNFDYETIRQKPHNLPSDYVGETLRQSINTISLNLSRKFYPWDSEKIGIITSVGIHKALYRDYENFHYLGPRPEKTLSELLESLFSFESDTYQSHSYIIITEDLVGLSGSTLFDVTLSKIVNLGMGVNYKLNQRTKNIGFQLRVGFKF